ncbi:MAG: sugar ABC transporter substrate-binding protein [Chloroflexota bacterium]|nr:sugar ABC transporter substrate-binding protein [Chloroflexota bacterium]
MRNNRFVVGAALIAALSFGGVVAAQEMVTLQVWTGSSSPAENAAKEAQFAAFQEANPNIELEVLISPDYGTQVQAAFASGDYPDVFTVGQFDLASLVDSGLVMPADGRIEAEGEIFPSLLSAFSVDGAVYCPPKDFSTLAVLYNKDYFAAAGLEEPTAEWTWADMAAAAQAVTDADIMTANGVDVLGISTAADRNRWLGFLYGNGANLMDAESNVTWNTPEAVEALEYYASFINNGTGAIPANLGGAGWNGEAFGRGLAAMTIEGNWAIGYLETDFPELNWGVVELPVSPNGGRGTLTFTECWAVGANTEYPEQAWALVNALTGTDGAMTVATSGFGVMPARSGAVDSWLETRGAEYAAFVNGAEYAVAPVFPSGFGDFTAAVDAGTVDVMNGDATAQEAMDDAAAIATEIHDEMMAS